MFFYAHDGGNSRYSPSIMNTLVDYDSASQREKFLIDLYASINCYGKAGAGVSADMVCEWRSYTCWVAHTLTHTHTHFGR